MRSSPCESDGHMTQDLTKTSRMSADLATMRQSILFNGSDRFCAEPQEPAPRGGQEETLRSSRCRMKIIVCMQQQGSKVRVRTAGRWSGAAATRSRFHQRPRPCDCERVDIQAIFISEEANYRCHPDSPLTRRPGRLAQSLAPSMSR